MSNNFFEEMEKGNVGLRFWAYIQGVPYIFLDGDIPTGSDGTAWQSAPNGASAHIPHNTYPANSIFTVKENTLDVSKGLESIGADISRRTGVTSPGQMSLTFRDDGSGFLVELFARALSTANTAELTENLTRNLSVGASTEINVDDHTGFDSSGLLFIGRETIHYSGKAGAAGVDARFTGLTRNVCALGNHDVYYNQHDYKASAPRLISDNPQAWNGRYIRVFAFLIDEFGRALNRGSVKGGWGNNDGYQIEIFRGIIDQPKPLADWTRFKVRAKGLEVLLDQEIGGSYPEASLVNAPGNKKWNEAGMVDPNNDFNGFYSDASTAILVQEGANQLHMYIQQWNTFASWFTDAPAATNNYTGDDSVELDTTLFSFLLSAIDSDLEGGICSTGELWHSLAETINGRIAAAGWGAHLKASIKTAGADGPWSIRVSAINSTTKFFRLGFIWSAKDSVGHLIGQTDDTVIHVGNQSQYEVATVFSIVPDHSKKTVGVVTEHATQIIYWLKGQNDGGEQIEPSSSHGYALLGDNEIIKYEADVDVSQVTEGTEKAYFDGMRVLKGVTRGVFDTKRTRHVITVDDLNKVTSSEVEIRFGFGFDDDAWSDSFLKLCHSTGTAAHNGSFDVLSKQDGAAISAAHFDLVSFNQYANSGGDKLDKLIRYFSNESINLKKFIEDFLKPRMCFFSAGNYGHNDYEYLLSLVEIEPALESEYAVSLTADDIDFDDPATFHSSNSRVVNRIRCAYRWNFSENKPVDGAEVVATDWDQVQNSNGIRSISWILKGQQWSYDQAYARVSMWALRAFQRYAHDYDILNVKVHNGKGLQVKPGQTVLLTLAGAPTSAGVRGFSGTRGVCIRSDHTWHDPGGTPTSVLTLVIESAVRQSVYCPSAVTHSAATVDGAPGLLLENNVYTAEGSATHFDASFFQVGDLVVIHNPGDYSTRDLRTIQTVTTATDGGDTYQAITLNSGLTNATAGGSNPAIVTYQNYNLVGSTQKERVFIANDSNALSVSNTASFKYV